MHGSVAIHRLGWSPVGKPLMTVCLYVIDGLMIDSGQPHMKKEAVGIARDNNIKKILLTHHHEDHSGNAGDIIAATGAEVFGHELTAKKMKDGFNIMPYQQLVWGKPSKCDVKVAPEVFEHGRINLTKIHTPGHAKDHTVYFEKNMGWLFSGDLYLGNRIKYFRSDEKIIDQITSLKEILNLDFDVLFCGHNPVFKNAKTAIDAKLRYLEDFFETCRLIWKKGIPASKAASAMNIQEALLVKTLSCGNASLENMVRSSYLEFEKQNKELWH